MSVNQPQPESDRPTQASPDAEDRSPGSVSGWWQSRGRALACATRGVGLLIAREPHGRLHLIATLAAVGVGLGLGLSVAEWVAVVLAAGLVWCCEAMNTSVERLCDVVMPREAEPDGRVRDVKDLAAGAVLLASLAALIVAAVILWRHATAA